MLCTSLKTNGRNVLPPTILFGTL